MHEHDNDRGREGMSAHFSDAEASTRHRDVYFACTLEIKPLYRTLSAYPVMFEWHNVSRI